MTKQLLHGDLTESILKSYYEVYNSLGYGFLEKVYENSLKISLSLGGLEVKQQWPIEVEFRGREVGKYFADLVVNDLVIVEVKAAKDLSAEHEAQLINYLKATGFEVGLLLNFGESPQFRRKIFTK